MTGATKPRWNLTDAQGTALDMRHLLRGLGADDALAQRVTAMTDLGGRDYVYVPPLPVDLAQHIVRLLPAASAAEAV